MRTTITLDDDVFSYLKETAYRAGKPFKQVMNETLRRGIAANDAPPRACRYRLEPSSLGGTLPGIDLDRALQLADDLEDEAIINKLEARK
jgi:hypothetical protein